jgi:imidazolonepropionase-like amidohydrolase
MRTVLTVPASLGTALFLALGAFGALGAPGQSLAIQVGQVITRDGEPIENGTILIQGGRITAVGAEVEIPWDAVVIERPELTAFPGFVDAYAPRGMDRANENLDVAPFLSVRDSIDPVNYFFENALRKGITTINVQQGSECIIGGQGLVVQPFGMTVDAMTVKTDAGLVLSTAAKRGKSTATQVQALRGAFEERGRREALFQGRDPEELEKPGRPLECSAWSVPDFEIVPRAEVDEKLAPLLPLVEGKLPAFIHCQRPGEVQHALDVARENGFLARTTLVLGPACWKAADEIAEAGVPVVLNDPLLYVERDPITGEERETFVPGVFRDKGVRFALASPNEQGLWYQAALSVGLGLTREEALDAVTTTPAEILGLGKRVGKLAPGADGNVLLWSGDPLSVTSFVELVVLGGEVVYDRSKDVRMKHLLEGLQPAGTAAGTAEEGDQQGEEGDGDEEPEVEEEDTGDPGEGDEPDEPEDEPEDEGDEEGDGR